MQTLTKEELDDVLQKHEAWVHDREDGVRAHLAGIDLSGADLDGADLGGAYMAEAILRGASLNKTDLRNADLSGADLRGVDLSEAVLSDFVNLSRANLDGATLPQGVPTVDDLDRRMMESAWSSETALNMTTWHSVCGTSHCRAGWTVTLAGEEGAALEKQIGTNAAAALIYAASGSHPAPNWYACHEDAMADILDRSDWYAFGATEPPIVGGSVAVD